MYKIIGADGQQYGPLPIDQLKRWISENRVNNHTMVLAEGAPDWRPLGSLPEFAAEFAAPPPLSNLQGAPPTLSEHRASSKIPAGICGILLGSLGVHKFILGYTGAGLIMLLVSVLTCFVASPVMHLIGLIEGVIYLTKPDSEFVRIYVDNRKEWF